MKADIKTLRALAAATNSLRYNPEIDPDQAAIYENLLVRLRDNLSAELDEQPPICPYKEGYRCDKQPGKGINTLRCRVICELYYEAKMGEHLKRARGEKDGE